MHHNEKSLLTDKGYFEKHFNVAGECHSLGQRLNTWKEKYTEAVVGLK